MRALVFGVEPDPDPTPADPAAGRLERNLRTTPMGLRDLPDPEPPGPDWVVMRTRLCGICGSDSKQVFMDTGGDWPDAAMTAFISFPQVLGHEVIGTIERVGPEARGLEPGQRVLLQCWLSCGPRGIDPVCPACAAVSATGFSQSVGIRRVRSSTQMEKCVSGGEQTSAASMGESSSTPGNEGESGRAGSADQASWWPGKRASDSAYALPIRPAPIRPQRKLMFMGIYTV